MSPSVPNYQYISLTRLRGNCQAQELGLSEMYTSHNNKQSRKFSGAERDLNLYMKVYSYSHDF